MAHVRIGWKMYDASDSGLRFAAGGFSGTGTGLAQRRRLRFVVPEACRAMIHVNPTQNPMAFVFDSVKSRRSVQSMRTVMPGR